MTHILANNIDESITPNPGKEKAVWMALDSLYFEDKYPVKEITNDMILEKRMSLEGKAGDRSGLRQMKDRWCQRHKINPYDDPNFGARPEKSNRADPLQKLTAGLYAQIDEAVRAEYTAELEALKDKLTKFEDENDDLKDKLGQTAASLTKANNELAHAVEKAKQSDKSKLKAETIAEQTIKSLDDYKKGAEKHFTDTLKVLRDDYDSKVIQQQAELAKIADELKCAKDTYIDEIEKQRDENERIRQKYMVISHNLEIKVKALETELSCVKTTKDAIELEKNQVLDEIVRSAEKLLKNNKLLSKESSAVLKESQRALASLQADIKFTANKSDLKQMVTEVFSMLAREQSFEQDA